MATVYGTTAHKDNVGNAVKSHCLGYWAFMLNSGETYAKGMTLVDFASIGCRERDKRQDARDQQQDLRSRGSEQYLIQGTHVDPQQQAQQDLVLRFGWRAAQGSLFSPAEAYSSYAAQGRDQADAGQRVSQNAKKPLRR